MRILLLITLIFFSHYMIKSQDKKYVKPDYEKIKKEVKNKESIFYYPKLQKRLSEFDTTLTNDEYFHLYYGYLYHKNYEPYWTSSVEDELDKFYKSDGIEEKDYNKIIKLTSICLQEFPFDLKSLNFLGYIYYLKSDKEMVDKISHRYNGIIEAMLSTGDGTSCENSIHVIDVSHEYAILRMFEFNFKGQSLVDKCDYLEVHKDERDINGLFFNVEKLMARNLEILKGDK